jgi:hypothetical protein
MSEVSIWVDQVYGLTGNSVFIRSMCPEEFPSQKRHAFVKWVEPRNSHSQKSRFSQEELILGHCKVHLFQRDLHLFALGAAAWGAFQEDHMLTELDFQPQLAGIVVIIEKGHIERQYEWFENPDRVKELSEGTRLFAERLGYLSFVDDSPLWLGLWFLSWVKSHRLPFVIAATGYETSHDALEELRQELKLDSDTPMIPGPSLRFDKGLIFDADHAKRVLSALRERIEESR